MASFPETLYPTLTLSLESSACTEELHPPMTLTTLPSEIHIQIFSIASKYESVIQPEYRNGYDDSRGFRHRYGYNSYIAWFEYFNDAEDRVRDANLALTAMSLALTCKSISALVLGDLLFYKVNSFGFRDTRVLINFMRGIKIEKAMAIQSVKLETCGWPAGFEFKPLPMDLWNNVRSFELRLVCNYTNEELCYSELLKGLPDQGFRNLNALTIIYWSRNRKHAFSWHLTRTRTEMGHDASQRVQDARNILRRWLNMINVDQLATEITRHVTNQWGGACKVDCVYQNFPEGLWHQERKFL